VPRGEDPAVNPIVNQLLLSLLWSARAAGYRLQPFVTGKEPGSRAPTPVVALFSAASAARWYMRAMESLVRGVILARCFVASERCLVAAARALASAVSSVPCCFLIAAILSRYSFSDTVPSKDPETIGRGIAASTSRRTRPCTYACCPFAAR
jgi:hypothetical protein